MALGDLTIITLKISKQLCSLTQSECVSDLLFLEGDRRQRTEDMTDDRAWDR